MELDAPPEPLPKQRNITEERFFVAMETNNGAVDICPHVMARSVQNGTHEDRKQPC